MEAISPYMEIATSYISTPYGVAAIAGVVLISVLLLVFSTQKEITYDDFNKVKQLPIQPSTTLKAAAPKKQKKAFKRKSKKTKESSEPEEDETQYDIVTPDEVADDIPITLIEPVEQVPVKKQKPKKKKQRREVVVEEVKEQVKEEVEEAPAPVEEEIQEPEVEEEAEPTEYQIEEAMQPVLVEVPVEVPVEAPVEVAETAPQPDIEQVVIVKAAPAKAPERKVKKTKKKVGNFGQGGNESLFQVVDQADLSEEDIETLLSILKSKEGDDNWLSAGKVSEETKDSLRRKCRSAELNIAELQHDVEVLKREMMNNSDDKLKLTMEIRSQEKKHFEERENLNSQVNELKNHSQSKIEEVTRLKQEIENRERVNNTLNLQLQQHRNNANISQQCVDLKNRVVELEEELAESREELQESREQYGDLERDIAKINTMEKKLLDKDEWISQLKEQNHQLDVALKSAGASDSALADAQTETRSLKAQLEQLQVCVAEYEKTKSALERVLVENETLRSELVIQTDTDLSSKLAAAAEGQLEQEVAAGAPAVELTKAQNLVTDLQSEVRTLKEKITELEQTPSESSMSSTVDISAEIAEQLQVAETQLSTVKQEYDDLKSELSGVHSARNSLAAELEAAQTQLSTATQSCEQLQAELVTVQAERESLNARVCQQEDTEKLDLAVKDRDRALAENKRFQEVLTKTEGILAQLQCKFEEDIQRWAKDLDEKRQDLEQERSRAVELEQKLCAESDNKTRLSDLEGDLSELREKLDTTEKQLKSEKRWHSETLLKLKEMETNATCDKRDIDDVETLQKANEMEQKWHAQTLTQLQQANTDVAVLQDKLSNKNADISQLTSENEELKQRVDTFASGNNLQDEVNNLKEKSDEAEIAELRYQLIHLTKELRESNSSNEYLKYRLASQTTDKKFTSI